ncbi:MAG: amino acid permease [Candidatus Micrarchaeota archaeon]
MPLAIPQTKPKPVLSLFDAVNVSLGSIIGAGIFVVIGAATALAGPAVFLSVLIAGTVAMLTGLASADLSRMFPRSGGAYTFASEASSNFFGFIVGIVWIFSNIVAGATVAVGFGYYLALLAPAIPIKASAAMLTLLATAIHLGGVKDSSRLNNVLVALKILILLFFAVTAIFFFKFSNFEPFAPFGLGGVVAGAATIFFAYAGFARVSVIADEVKDAARNVPRAIIISILLSTFIYVVVSVAAVGVAGYLILANSNSPLADAIDLEGLGFGFTLVSIGALIATATVILASILGISRVISAMALNGDLPSIAGEIDEKSGVPKKAILVGGSFVLLLIFLADLPSLAYISSFSLLLYYVAINLSGLRLLKEKRIWPLLGFLSCLFLMLSLPLSSWAIGLAVVAIASGAYGAARLFRK